MRVFIRGGKKSHGPGQHEHEQFLRDWTKLLTERGCVTDGAMTFPTAEQLAKTDVLILHAQEGGEIPPESRAGLEIFLKRGGGVVVIHAAAVPQNHAGDGSAYLKSVIGGSWVWGKTKWLEAPMSLYYVDRTHPIALEAGNYDMTDEIYYDLDVSPDVHVLAAAYTPNLSAARRADPRSKPPGNKVTVYDIQPQMWVYENTWAGGAQPYRAFVHLPGHIYSNFSMPHFRAVLLRGIAWAGQRANVNELTTKAELATLRYPQGGTPRPEQTAATVELHPDFKMSLAASEPLINKVMNIDWDAQGRMWVCETPEYPDGRRVNPATDYVQRWQKDNKITADGKNYDRPALDRISILTAPDGKGTFTKKQVFFEGLERVTSFVLFKDGVIAAAAPDVWLLRDTDGDGKADTVTKLYTNLGDGDTHAVINNLRWGYDGWIYATHGYSSTPNVKNSDGTKSFGGVGSGVVRFKPDGSAFEQYSSKGGNTWGLQIAWDNEVFWTQPTSGDLLMHVVMSEAQLSKAGVKGLPTWQVANKSVQTYSLIPYDQLPYVQIDQVGRFTAAAGAVIYGGGSWPEKWNYNYFTTEPTINILYNATVKPTGVTYAANREAGRETVEFAAGRNLWFRPIEVRTGPDGAVYVVDFCNQAIIHNDTRGPKHGPHNAAVRPDRDHYYGRVWRIDHKDAKKLDVPNLAKASSAELVKALDHPNDHVRQNAVRLMVEANKADVVPTLRKLVASKKAPQARVAALWTLARLGQADAATLTVAAGDANDAVRKNAMQVAAVTKTATKASTLKLTQDTNARVRLEALLALAETTPDAEVANALVGIYPSLDDAWSKAAFMTVAAKAPALFLEAAVSGPDASKNAALIAPITGMLVAGGSADEAAKLVITLAARPASQDAMKVAMLNTLSGNTKLAAPAFSPELKAALQKLIGSGNARVASAALPLAVRWDQAGTLSGDVKREVGELTKQLSDKSVPDDTRAEVATTLLGVRQVSGEILPAVTGLLKDGTSPALQSRVVEALGALPDDAVGAALVQALPGMDGTAQATTFNQLLKRSAWSMALVNALDSGAVPLTLLGPANAHRLRLHPDAKVSERATAVIAKLRGPEAKEKDALIAKFTPEVEKPGNVVKGKELFTANCAVCHQFGGGGALVGPPLDGMGAHGAAELLVAILDPNREVDQSFAAWSIETKDGESYDGVITRENNSIVALRNAAGEQEIRKENIRTRRNTGRSLMPEGLEALGAEGLRDILAYVCGAETRFRFIDLTPALTVDSRKGMYLSLEAENQRLHIAKRGIVTALGVPFRIADPAKMPLGNDVMVLRGGQNGSFSKTQVPQKVEVKVGVAAKQLHILGGVAGWGFPAVPDKIPALKVTVQYAGGATEEFVSKNGEEFGDYNRVTDVPGSRLVNNLTQGDQLRLYSLKLKGGAVVEKVSFESYNNAVAPTTVAVTADLSDAPLAGALKPTAAAPVIPAAPFTWGAGTKVLLVGGGSSHDYQKFFNLADTATLQAAGYSVNYTEDGAVTARELAKVDVAILSVNAAKWATPECRQAVVDFAAAGKGLILLHPGLWYNYGDWPEYNRVLAGGGARGHDSLGEFTVNVVNKKHPITQGVTPSFKIIDELYYMIPDEKGAAIEVLAETSASKKYQKPHPSVFVVKHPQARIVGFAIGHDARAHDLPEYKQLLLNSTKWAAGK